MLHTIKQLFSDYVLHLNTSLAHIVQTYNKWTYLILFVAVFCETGLVVTPFLPGDTLLFAAGTIAADSKANLDVVSLFLLLSVAAVVGDTVNYWIGSRIGHRAFSGNIRFLKKEHLDRTHRFYEKYGGKAIVLARFVPIVRTFAPFVAGVGAMNYRKFLIYNFSGGLAWVAILLGLGYKFGQLEYVQKHYELIILAIVVISVLPMVFEFVRVKFFSREEKA